MKNIKKIILIIIIIFITFCIFKVIKKEHTVKYKIDKYSIKEHFYISNDHYYDLIIKDKKNTYIYTLNIDLNKNKKIIKNIEEFKSNELTCIVSTYKKSDEKGIYCPITNKIFLRIKSKTLYIFYYTTNFMKSQYFFALDKIFLCQFTHCNFL